MYICIYTNVLMYTFIYISIDTIYKRYDERQRDRDQERHRDAMTQRDTERQRDRGTQRRRERHGEKRHIWCIHEQSKKGGKATRILVAVGDT